MSPVARQLEARVSRVRDHLRRRAGIATAAWVAAGIALILIIAWLMVGPDGWTQGSDVPVTLDMLGVALIGGAIWRLSRLSRRRFDEISVAAVMEDAAGIRRGVVRGALELGRATPHGVSGSLAQRAVSGAVYDLGERSESDLSGGIGDAVARWSRRGLGAAAVLGVALAGLTILSPARTTNALAGIASPFSTMLDPILPPLAVLPGSVEVLRGTDVELEVSAAGREAVALTWQAAGDVARTISLPVVEGRAIHVFRTVSAAIEYRVVDDEGNRSGTYEIVPIDPLFVSDLVLGVTYPAHTGLPPEEYRGDPPPLRIPFGTTLHFTGLTSRPLSSVALLDSLGARVLGFEVDGNGFEGRWTPNRAGDFEWRFRDELGGPAEIPPDPLEIELMPDREPEIRIAVPGRDTVMPLSLRQQLVLEAGDDYGLRRVELVAYRVTSFGERHAPVSQGFDVGGQRAILVRPLLDLRDWGLLPGDTIHYFARAIDGHPAAQVSTSAEYLLWMPRAGELRREAEGSFEAVADRLEELAAEVRRQATENRDRAIEAAAGQEGARGGEEERQAEFERREELERALESQARASAEVDSLRSEMEALERIMREAGQADPELRRQLEELQEALSRTTGDDLRRRMEEMAEALDRDDVAQANRSLEEMAADQEEFRQRIEEALERFRRAALEQDFRATTSEAQELARQEQALADAMKEDDAPELRADQQQELAEQAAGLEERMEALRDRLEALDEPDAAAGVEKAREAAAEARRQMQEAQEQARRGEASEAGDQAQRAADAMEEAAREMEEAMQQMAQEQMAAQQEALLRTADDALSLARRQAELREQMRGAAAERMVEMRADEASLLRGVQNMAENLQIASQSAMGENRELSAQMGRAMESLESTIAAMENRRGATPSASARAEQAIGDLNQLALMAMAGAEQMGQEGEGQSGEELSDRLEQLAQEQGNLMNQSTQIMPMQLGEQAMAQQLQEMAQGQESVASDLGDLAEEPGSEQSLGDLQQLAREALALAEELGQGRLTPETVQRQERLFHRLLDAGRSLERDEFSEERESERPGAFERGEVLSLTDQQLGVMLYEVPDGEQLRSLSPAVRQLVLEYFERLNRIRPDGGPGGGER